MQKHTFGFTALEALVALLIVSLLLTIGLPGWQMFMAENRMTTVANEYMAFLRLARTEAIKRSHTVILCPITPNSEACARQADWSHGWMVFNDDNHNRERDPNEAILRSHQLFQGNIMVSSSQRHRIIYQPSGRSDGSNATVVFCDLRQRAKTRQLILAGSGRARLEINTKSSCPVS